MSFCKIISFESIIIIIDLYTRNSYSEYFSKEVVLFSYA